MKKVFSMGNKVVSALKQGVRDIHKDESGMELLQIVILCLIAVIIGGTLLKFFDVSFTEIGGLMVDKIKSIFSL